MANMVYKTVYRMKDGRVSEYYSTDLTEAWKGGAIYVLSHIADVGDTVVGERIIDLVSPRQDYLGAVALFNHLQDKVHISVEEIEVYDSVMPLDQCIVDRAVKDLAKLTPF